MEYRSTSFLSNMLFKYEFPTKLLVDTSSSSSPSPSSHFTEESIVIPSSSLITFTFPPKTLPNNSSNANPYAVAKLFANSPSHSCSHPNGRGMAFQNGVIFNSLHATRRRTNRAWKLLGMWDRSSFCKMRSGSVVECRHGKEIVGLGLSSSVILVGLMGLLFSFAAVVVGQPSSSNSAFLSILSFLPADEGSDLAVLLLSSSILFSPPVELSFE
mmetsp:Transcript_16781/g.35304  ORF Transcript_16781/g.35304 Transcript_16781/m.35304 type:complete len:214 (+) Transcript_16781:490-1131(+)